MENTTNLPAWNLNDLFSGPGSKDVSQHLNALTESVNAFVSKYEGKISSGGVTLLLSAIVDYEAISDSVGKMGAYAFLLYSENRTISDVAVFYQKTSEALNDLTSKLVFLSVEINELSEEVIQQYYNQSDDLKHYKPWLDHVRLYKQHMLSNEMEQLMHEKSMTSESAWVRLYDELCADMRFEINGEELAIAEVLNLLAHKDSEQRKAAAMALSKGLSMHARTIAMILNTLSQNLSLDNKWRKYESVDASRHLSNQIDAEVVDALTETVKHAYPKLAHKYYALKAKHFGVKQLNYWDRNAPYPQAVERNISWNDAKDMVLKAYTAFSPKMANIAQEFFDKNWIDADLRAGKDSGAFSHPVVPSAHPYILMNYHGKQRCVMTLAHELGHGIHQVLSRSQGALMADTPLTLAETASVFGEMLTFQSLLSAATPEEKPYLLAGKIEDMLNTVVRQIAFYEFEKRFHTARLDTELSVDAIAKIWMDVQRESLGDAISMDESYHVYWSYISHFFHAPFYVYAYAFGDCLVNSLYSYYMQNPDGFQDKYLALLSAGGSKRYDEALKPFGFDLKDSAFWAQGLSMIERLIDEFEKSIGD